MRRAFVIGSNGPTDFGTVKQLEYAESDARRVAACLASDTCGFQVGQPTLDMRPKDVVEAVEAICESCEAGDDLLLYFSGHGILDAKGNLLLLWHQSAPGALLTSTIATSKIMSALEACRANNRVLVLDCCHAGAAVSLAGFKGATEIALSERIVPPENYAIIMASGRLDRARELGHVQAGFLTDTFCKGLTDSFAQADRDGDKRISIADISWWLGLCADEHNAARPGEPVPYPMVFGRTRGEFYLTVGIEAWAPCEIEGPNGATMVVLPVRFDDESEHDYAVCVSKHLVTNAQFAAYVEATGMPEPKGKDYVRSSDGALIGDPGAWMGPFYPWEDERFRDHDKPVVCVSFQDAKDYCQWLSTQSDTRTFLPTSKLWDYAAFGTVYPSRDPRTWLRTAAKIEEKAASPSPVSDAPERINRFGLSDMVGNVWEWCDAQHRSVALFSGFEPKAELRGGGYLDDLSEVEPFLSDVQLSERIETRHSDLGFRVAGLILRRSLNEAVQQKLLQADVVSSFDGFVP